MVKRKETKTYSCPCRAVVSVALDSSTKANSAALHTLGKELGWDGIGWCGGWEYQKGMAAFHIILEVSLTVLGCACFLWFFCWHRSIIGCLLYDAGDYAVVSCAFSSCNRSSHNLIPIPSRLLWKSVQFFSQLGLSVIAAACSSPNDCHA